MSRVTKLLKRNRAAYRSRVIREIHNIIKSYRLRRWHKCPGNPSCKWEPKRNRRRQKNQGVHDSHGLLIYMENGLSR